MSFLQLSLLILFLRILFCMLDDASLFVVRGVVVRCSRRTAVVASVWFFVGRFARIVQFRNF
jgi:hypothetical protein